MPLNVWILVLAQALAMCTAPLIVFIGSIQGRLLAPVPEIATLPVGLVVVGTVLAIKPATWLMSLWGRKAVMLLGTVAGITGGCLGALAAWCSSFPLLCVAAITGGAGVAVVHQYRFAAMESVSDELAGSAAARVLLGGLVAAWLGPELALVGGGAEAVYPFMGGWIALAAVQLIALIVLWLGYRSGGERVRAATESKGRHLSVILRQPLVIAAVSSAAIGYAIMGFIMTATPLGMTEMAGHSLDDAKRVIQVHLMAMYLPSLISGWLTRVVGVAKMMLAGLVAYTGCVVLGLSGTSYDVYLGTLILLGVGWNLLFVGGTTLLPSGYRTEERFRVQGFNDLVVFGSQAAAAMSAGAVLTSVGWNGVLWLALPFIALHGLLMVYWLGQNVALLSILLC